MTSIVINNNNDNNKNKNSRGFIKYNLNHLIVISNAIKYIATIINIWSIHNWLHSRD